MTVYSPPPDKPEERACLVGVKLPGATYEQEKENLQELGQLASTAGAEVVETIIQQRTRVDGATYIGKGKIEDIERLVQDKGLNLVVFDDDLSPAQARNIENLVKVNVIDRTELILDIFSRRARTRQAKLQVEIAQLNYALPRLKRLWDHLSRQAGGIGTRGPGETQLEVDRRRVRERILFLKKELEKISKRVGERRKNRKDVFNATIVGYTNAGKSTLLNRLSGAGVLESGQLFSTLDSISRKVGLPDGEEFVLTDTVGFIRKLPTHLVASFRATLIDVAEADLLLHLVDVSSPLFEDRILIVNDVLGKVLKESGGQGKTLKIPTIVVFNKTDRETGKKAVAAALKSYPASASISAAKGDGIDTLLGMIKGQIDRNRVKARVELPVSDGRTIAFIESSARILERTVEEETIRFVLITDKKDIGKIEKAGNVRVTILPHDPNGI
ncbi:MAG: GTPase HflX [Candidatus Krumholzibacteriota bacterium]|nr:GTPase HflX [Candidatus Krumholzibacteriota bacterium]